MRTRRGSDIKLDMLEVVVNVAEKGKVYRWANNLAKMIKKTCTKFQEEGMPIKFPSLIIWISMYNIQTIADLYFNELKRISKWNFKSFSMDRNQ